MQKIRVRSRLDALAHGFIWRVEVGGAPPLRAESKLADFDAARAECSHAHASLHCRRYRTR